MLTTAISTSNSALAAISLQTETSFFVKVERNFRSALLTGSPDDIEEWADELRVLARWTAQINLRERAYALLEELETQSIH